MSGRVTVRRHRRRRPGSRPRTGFDWRREALIAQKRTRIGVLEGQGDIEQAERLRGELHELEYAYKRSRLAVADREGDTEGAERLRRELDELERKDSGGPVA